MPAKQHRSAQPPMDWNARLGFWSAVISTAAGILYFLVIAAALVLGQFTFPPPEWLQLFGGISTLALAPVLVVVFACLHQLTPPHQRGLSISSLAFAVLFAAMVSINRFSQLGAVAHGQAAGITDGISWFLAYGSPSIMFGLELLGWGWFLGIAALLAAPLFSGTRRRLWLRWLLVTYGAVALVSAAAYLIQSPLSVIGFAAWGLVLFIITGLMAAEFRLPGRG